MPKNQNKLEQVNTVDIDKISIITQSGLDVSLKDPTVFVQLNIFEDIYSNVLSGNILIKDGTNFVSEAAICGQEHLHVRWKTPGRDKVTDITFQIFKISQRTEVEQKNIKLYTFHFISLEGIKNSTTRIDQHYSTSIENIVKDVFNNYLRNDDIPKELIDVERTRDRVAVTVPGWKPLKLINWLCRRSISETYGNADYLFYETVNGFHFISCAALAKQEVVQNYIQSPLPIRPIDDERVHELDPEFRTYEKSVIHESFNMLNHTQKATFASKLITHDLVTKKIEEHTYDYLKRTGSDIYAIGQVQSHMEPYPILAENDMLTKQANSNVFFYPKHKDLYAGFKNNHAEGWLQERLSNIHLLGHIKVSLTVPGDSGGPGRSREVGDIVTVQLPAVEYEPSHLEVDPYLKGKYMITAIRHIINIDNYKLELELSKDSLPTPLPIAKSKESVATGGEKIIV